MLGAMAKKEGLTFVETLTGFKWMANEAYDLESLTGKDIFRSSLCCMYGSGAILLLKKQQK